MRASDLVSLPLAALWQQKSRTLMTTLGVVFGSFVLAASLSISQGVQDTVARESHRTDFLRRVTVQPKWDTLREASADEPAEVKGIIDESRRERIRRVLADRSRTSRAAKPRVPLTAPTLQMLAGIEHVECVVPLALQSGYALVDGRSQAADVSIARPDDERCRSRIAAGRFFDRSNERAAVVTELLAYRWGLADDESITNLVGKTLRLEFRPEPREGGFRLSLARPDGSEPTREERAVLDQITRQIPAAIAGLPLSPDQLAVLEKLVPGRKSAAAEPYSAEFPIVGVLRMPTDEERRGRWDPLFVESDVVLPYQTGAELYFQNPEQADRGVPGAVVIVDDERNAREVVAQVEELGLGSRAALDFIERQRLIYLLIFGGMTCVAAVAMLVAALGIANTMLMSVLERTREIGIMKAVGAGDGQLQFIFLVEGGLIGLVGGGLGLALAWAASFPGDAWVRSMVSRDLKFELKEALFVFPPSIGLSVMCFAVLVTTVAAFYPARRAARVDPVAALRHE